MSGSWIQADCPELPGTGRSGLRGPLQEPHCEACCSAAKRAVKGSALDHGLEGCKHVLLKREV